jgi:hypothetical protein
VVVGDNPGRAGRPRCTAYVQKYRRYAARKPDVYLR